MRKFKLLIAVFIFIVSSTLIIKYIIIKNDSKQQLTKSFSAPKINPKDGAEMMLIPFGEFLMGTSKEDIASFLKEHPKMNSGDNFINELPQRKVVIDAFYIYKTEVTVAQYRKFCKATNHPMPSIEPTWKWQDNHPIVDVTWNDAKAYADWAGAALPTEAQWEKAARGIDGQYYPWGNTWDGNKLQCSKVFGDAKKTAPVGSFTAGASPYGVMDMAGNVWEWCNDWFKDDYYKSAPLKNPKGPATGMLHVLRGGSWYDGYEGYYLFRCAARYFGDYPDKGNVYVGFRCVENLQMPNK